ncbi:MAG: hypothetical protein WDO68_09665 [Gammaproteobacteria bacterium]
MNVMAMLIRREFWEHRWSLVIAPLALCALYLIFCAIAGAGMNVSLLKFGDQPPMSAAYLIVMHTVFTIMLYGLMAIVAFFYLCDCLYAERKDRGILFWKSMPVSDAMTVLSKLAVALIAIPAVVYALSFVTNLLAFAVFKILFHTPAPAGVTSDWTFTGWLQVNGYLIVDILVLALWFAPVAAYQLLISAWAPRAPFVITLLPPLTLALFERLFFQTSHIAGFLNHRLGGVAFGPHRGEGVQGVIDAVNALPLLAKPELWIGALVAAALIFVTIRVRRHSDDS